MRFTASRLACLTSSLVTLQGIQPLTRGNRRPRSIFSVAVVLLAFLSVGVSCSAQDMSTGSLNVTVTDPGGALIPGATLVLKDLGTNDIHTVTTKNDGTVVIPFLNPATYTLTVTKDGFATSQYSKVVVTTNQVTNLAVALKVGATTETVSVAADRSPILNTTSNTLSTNLDMKQVADLPTSARSVRALAFLVPGAVDDDINNLPGGALNESANGFSTLSDRNKSGGFDQDTSAVTQRLESTQEMTIETGELDASKGGTSAMDIGYLTKRGTNQFHGQLFEDYRSEALNANSWSGNFAKQPRGLLIINDFGASVGGPLLKNRLFFFASLGDYRRPTQTQVVTTVPTDLALSGVYSYFLCNAGTGGTTGKPCVTGSQVATENVLQAGASAGCATCLASINPLVATNLANIKAAIAMPGVTITPAAASDLNHYVINFQHHSTTIQRFPALRMDYNVTRNFRLTGVASGTFSYSNQTGNPPYPGTTFANQATSSKTRNYQVVGGFDWTLTPNIVNALRVGYLYTNFKYNSNGVGVPTADMIAQGQITAGLSLTTGLNPFNDLFGGSLYPMRSLKDDTTWSHGKHTISFGAELATQVDHYYNNEFVPQLNINSLSTGDPAKPAVDAQVTTNGTAGSSTAESDVESLYATLDGRVSSYAYGQFVNSRTKIYSPDVSFDLHEKLTQAAVFAQDQWKATPTLTLNAGLRWDFIGASTDETGFYTHPTISDLWGPSGQGNLFKPGTLSGNFNAVESPAAQGYAPTYVHPEPMVGFAWNPRGDSDSVIGRVFGNGKTVVRSSFTLKNYTEGTQNFWNFGSNQGANFNTTFSASPVSSATSTAGFYSAGSYIWGMAQPPNGSLANSPIPYQQVLSESALALTSTTFSTFDPHIRQPYVESWEFGIQRQLTSNQVLEVRYVGNVSKDQWLAKNYNEINIFENGFLADFKNAQANLALSGNTTFKGPNPTPVMDQAFKTSSSANSYTNSTFIADLEQGQAGAMANTLSGHTSSGIPYFCSLVGANFPACAAKGFAGTGSAPINFWEANPYAERSAIYEMGNYGSSNYNALQIEYRQNPTHGMQFDVNYTFSKGLGIGEAGSTAPGYYGGRGNSSPGLYTLRNPGLNYFPSSFDVRHVMHASGTYDFPFGHGRQFLNQSRIANAVVGGWTIGTIIGWQTGEPHLLTGGYDSFNTNDGGITLTNVTTSQLQHSIRARHVAGQSYVQMLDPKYIGTNGANLAYISPNTTPGTIGNLVWLHAPANFNTDMSLTKLVPVYREVNLKLQGVFLNAFNHVSWTGFTTGIQSTSFGTSSSLFASARNIELRANVQF